MHSMDFLNYKRSPAFDSIFKPYNKLRLKQECQGLGSGTEITVYIVTFDINAPAERGGYIVRCPEGTLQFECSDDRDILDYPLNYFELVGTADPALVRQKFLDSQKGLEHISGGPKHKLP